MPDSHNGRRETCRRVALSLDGLLRGNIRSTAGGLFSSREFRRELNLLPRGHTYAEVSDAESNHDEIDQRNQGRADAGGDQGVVDAKVVWRTERWLVGFIGHFGGLGQASRPACEADHIGRAFFSAWSWGTGLANQRW
jgi:hypothetical protein